VQDSQPDKLSITNVRVALFCKVATWITDEQRRGVQALIHSMTWLPWLLLPVPRLLLPVRSQPKVELQQPAGLVRMAELLRIA
jgi:hypothetical protein